MKQFLKTILILTFSGLLFSCSGILSDDDKTATNEDGSYITLNVGASARTVLPTVTLDDFVYFELKGTKENESRITLGTWNSVAEMQEATIAVSQGKWKFTLSARIGNKYGAEYEATTEKEIVLGENALSFDLYLYSNGYGNGAFSITLSYADSANAENVSYAIASLETYYSTAVSGYETVRLEPENHAVTFVVDSIKASSFFSPYRAKVTFYTEDGAVISNYRELVVVMENKTSTATRTVRIDNNANYTITYELNGGNFAGGSLVPEVFNTKTPLALTDAVEREHYTFAGWYTDADCTDGNEITTTKGREADLTVYAKWLPCVYTVTFETNGGSEIDSQQVTYTEKATEPPAPEKQYSETASYIFCGWYTDGGCTVPFDFATPIDSNITLYAKWAETIGIVAEKIVSLTEDTAFCVAGAATVEDIRTVNSALKTLAEANADIRVSLDLSNVTGLTKLEAAYDGQYAQAEEMLRSFYGCTNLTEIVLPASIETIGHESFKNCTALTSVTIANGTKTIDTSAFENCAALTDITLPETITSINSLAFGYCTNLMSITIPDGVESIQSSTFTGCSNLISVTIPESVTEIKDGAFKNCTSLVNMTIPSGVTAIGSYSSSWSSGVFAGCTSLTTVTISGSVDYIGYASFKDCTALTSVTLENGITEIRESAFQNCTSLESITFPDSMTVIGAAAFSGCSSFTNVIIGDSIQKILANAFENCTSLESVTIGSSVTEIYADAFKNDTNLTSAIFKVTEQWSKRPTNAAESYIHKSTIAEPSSAAAELLSSYLWIKRV